MDQKSPGEMNEECKPGFVQRIPRPLVHHSSMNRKQLRCKFVVHLRSSQIWTKVKLLYTLWVKIYTSTGGWVDGRRDGD